jgi:hypothetical protein
VKSVAEALAVVPALPPLSQEVLDSLPVHALVDLRRQLHHMTAEVEATLAHRLATPTSAPSTALPPDDDLITLNAAASLIGCSTKWLKRNRPECLRPLSPRTLRVSKSALLKWAAGRRA